MPKSDIEEELAQLGLAPPKAPPVMRPYNREKTLREQGISAGWRPSYPGEEPPW